MTCHHSFTPLFSRAGVSLGDYRCRAPMGQSGDEECVSHDTIAFVRRGVFEKRVGSRAVAATSGHAIFYQRGEVHRTNHPIDHGDDCTVIEFEPEAAAALLRDLAGREADDTRAFASPPHPTSPALHLRQWRLLRRLSRDRADPVEAHEELLGVAATALAPSLECPRAQRARRGATRAAHRDLAHDTALLLASGFDRRWTLDEIAGAVHSSPYHLSRVFRGEMGVPLHRFLMRLRLREAVNRLARGADDLTVLALELGFAGRGHLSDAFGKEFGVAPSRVRAELSDH